MSANEFVLKKITPECRHNRFHIDETLNFVKCGLCGEHLNPIWVIAQLANRESRARRTVSELEHLAKKTEQKLRCKCEHCGNMTRIQR